MNMRSSLDLKGFWSKRNTSTQVIAIAIGLLSTISSVSFAGEATDCPSARSCSRYSLWNVRWPGASGSDDLNIPYYVDATQPWVTNSEAIDAISSAFHTWERANERIHFEFKGEIQHPAVLGDGINEISWAVAGGIAGAYTQTLAGTDLLEVDTVFLLPYPVYVAIGCQQSDNSCTPLHHDFVSDSGDLPSLPSSAELPVWNYFDIQTVMTHEAGHWLSLGDLSGPAAAQLTMFESPGSQRANWVERRASTLGLGDILGVRSAYPCQCSPIAVFEP